MIMHYLRLSCTKLYTVPSPATTATTADQKARELVASQEMRKSRNGIYGVCYLIFLIFNVKNLSPAALYFDICQLPFFLTAPPPIRDSFFITGLPNELKRRNQENPCEHRV